MAESKIRDIARRVIDELWNDGHPDSVEELYSEDVTLRIPGRSFEGRDGIRQFIGLYHEAFPDLHIDIRGYYTNDTDDGGVMHWTFNGTHDGDLMGLSATGNEISVEGMTLSRMSDGKIIQDVVLWDRLDQFDQLGVSPEELERFA